jgi:hypothetical protein
MQSLAIDLWRIAHGHRFLPAEGGAGMFVGRAVAVNAGRGWQPRGLVY